MHELRYTLLARDLVLMLRFLAYASFGSHCVPLCNSPLGGILIFLLLQGSNIKMGYVWTRFHLWKGRKLLANPLTRFYRRIRQPWTFVG